MVRWRRCCSCGCFNSKDNCDWSRMDRTMYGKVLPGTYYPFRCAMKENGISPGCEYLFNKSVLLLAYCVTDIYRCLSLSSCMFNVITRVATAVCRFHYNYVYTSHFLGSYVCFPMWVRVHPHRIVRLVSICVYLLRSVNRTNVRSLL